ncbi:calcium/sodium antiporter [Candidatus Woesearchaeota archaeon]|nr:calcium/sodium antiporter [Candidatus Woesearchaeota archaeon]
MIKGADLLIKGASAISLKYNVSEMTIGLTVVALGTSLPELVVNIYSSIRGENDLIIGNIAGSNVANTLLVLGVGALFVSLVFSKNSFKIDIPFSLGSVFALLLLIFSSFLLFGELVLFRFHGVLLLLLFFVYLFIILRRKKEFVENVEKVNSKLSVFYVLIGSLGLYFGGNWVVGGAISISESLGISTMFIGSSIIAFGTSLPELVTIIISVLKNKNDLAVGNVIGSNIFNVLLVLGVSALVAPIGFSSFGVLNFLFVIISILLLTFFLMKNKIKNHYHLNKYHGLIFLILYASYLLFMYFK